MLPEKLSNEICSLRPQEDKLTFSVELEICDFSQIKTVWIGPGIINSNQRFTYEEAEKCILSKKGDYAKDLGVLNKIAKNLRLNRLKNGSIDFERTDVSFNLNENGEPISVEKNAHKFT